MAGQLHTADVTGKHEKTYGIIGRSNIDRVNWGDNIKIKIDRSAI